MSKKAEEKHKVAKEQSIAPIYYWESDAENNR